MSDMAKVKRRPFPAKHLDSMTPEAWRQHKREQWRVLMNALSDFEYGSAYTPGGPDMYHLQRLARRVDMALKKRGWVAW